MPTYGYEFYLRVFNSISQKPSKRVRYRVEHSKIKFTSTHGHVICDPPYENKHGNLGETGFQKGFKLQTPSFQRVSKGFQTPETGLVKGFQTPETWFLKGFKGVSNETP